MDESSEETSHPVGEETQRQIMQIFDEMHLIDYLPKTPEAKSIAIFGAGALPIEVEPLISYFIGHQLGKPKITAFDTDTDFIAISDYYFQRRNVDLEYRSGADGNVENPDTLGEEKYDMIVIRNPNVRSSKSSWINIFANAFLHLKSGGAILATTETDQSFVKAQLEKRGKIEKACTIPETVPSTLYFSERDLYIARKVVDK